VPQDWTARERVAMQLRTVAGEVRLVHPTLGFSIKVPEGLAVDTEALSALSAMIALYPSTHAYAFSTPDSKVRIRVVGFKAKHIAPRVFAQAFASLESGMIRQFAANAGDLTVRWLQDDVQPDARKAELHVVVGEAHARARALVDQLGTGNELMIMLSVESASDQAVSIAESFRTNDL
jgi:hypothetical protein